MAMAAEASAVRHALPHLQKMPPPQAWQEMNARLQKLEASILSTQRRQLRQQATARFFSATGWLFAAVLVTITGAANARTEFRLFKSLRRPAAAP
jgi:hypothetical protein